MENEPPIVGLDGTTLADMWDPDPRAYLSICVPKMPNFFIYFGPNGGAGSGSAIFFLESVTLYLVKLVKKIQREYLKSMVVTYVEIPPITFFLDMHHLLDLKHEFKVASIYD